MALTDAQKQAQLLAWANGTGPRPAWVAPDANLQYIQNSIRNSGVAATVTSPMTTENQWWANTASTAAAPDAATAQQQLTAYILGQGPRPAWLADLPPSQVAGVESLKVSAGQDSRTPAQLATYVSGWSQQFLASGVNSGAYAGGAAYQAAQGGPTGPTTSPAAPPGAAATPQAGFIPTAAAQGVSGVADPNQPFGAGFGSDYGLDPSQDPNFAFGSGSTAPPVKPFTAQPGQIVTTPNAEPFTAGTLSYSTRPDGSVQIYSPAGTFGAFHPLPAGVTAPTNPSGPTVISTPKTGTGTGSAAQQNALATLKSTLDTYGLGNMADWAWGEIVGGKSEQQVLLDLMQTQQFKTRFPAIDARAKAGLPSISPGDYVSYENQATQLMRQAGLPSGFWDSPSDFTHLLASDVSINELSKRLDLATQAAYQVPADVRASLARDYGVGPGQLAAFFLDEKTAMPLIQRDFTAAQIGGAAYRTGYGSTKTEDERLTDLGVNPGQAQQGFNQLTLQRQLFSGLPGENTTGISRDAQLSATFGGDTKAQEEILRRSQTRVAAFAGGGSFAQGGVGAAQGA